MSEHFLLIRAGIEEKLPFRVDTLPRNSLHGNEHSNKA